MIARNIQSATGLGRNQNEPDLSTLISRREGIELRRELWLLKVVEGKLLKLLQRFPV